MGQADPVARTWCAIVIKRKFSTRDERDLPFCKLADAQFGTLHIGQNRNWSRQFVFYIANDLVAGLMVFMGPMTKVETEYVRTGLEERKDGCTIRTGRSKCGDDLCITLASHSGLFADEKLAAADVFRQRSLG